MKAELAQAFPQELRQLGGELPDVLLSYQQRLLASTALHQVTICEKSRRIGMTWAIAADAVLSAGSARSAGGMDVLYIGYNLDMAREFIDTAAMWAKAFLPAASEVEEFLFKDQDEAGADRDIQAFRISFGSGFDIVALTSKPRSLRGRQGYLIFDEAAFHDDLAGMMKAGLAFLMWGGKILVISTHDGEANPFNGLVTDARSGRKPFKVLRVTFDEAIADGLYERVALMMKARGQEIADKEMWISEIRAFYGDDAEEELDAIPAQGSGVALGRAMIEARSDPDIPVLRWTVPDSFARQPEHIRVAECADWLEQMVRLHLDRLLPDADSVFGQGFARYADLSVLWPLQILKNMKRLPPFIIEMGNVPFAQQKQILFYVVRRLPRFRAGALDAGGNGSYLAEAAAQEFGFDRIEQVKFSEQWYRDEMPKFIAAFEDDDTTVPRDRDIINDHASLRKIKGVIKVPDLRVQDTKDKNRKRHGDSAIAHALAYYASLMDVVPMEFQSLGTARPSSAIGDFLGGAGGGRGGYGDYFGG